MRRNTPLTAKPVSEPRPERPLTAEERKLRNRLDPERIPRHVAVIPDGNGRWARAHGMADRIKGHEAGIEAIRDIIESAARIGIKVLSIYAFSMDNWLRARHETSALMRYFRRFLVSERANLAKNDFRIVHSGRREDLPRYVIEALDKTIEATAANSGLTINLAVSYSGREEIVMAARSLAADAAAGRIKPDDIDRAAFENRLYHPELGHPDLLIRTSGERRISDFLLYQMNYAEIHFTPVLWPDFRRIHLLEALVDYQKRERRFGREMAARPSP